MLPRQPPAPSAFPGLQYVEFQARLQAQATQSGAASARPLPPTPAVFVDIFHVPDALVQMLMDLAKEGFDYLSTWEMVLAGAGS